MHALFFLQHSSACDEELRFALRGIERNCPFIEKVWIFGDRPHFLSDDRTLIEHVPQAAVADACGVKTPVTNFFLLFWLASLIPELSPEFLWFCDDFIVLEPLSETDARRSRYLDDLSHMKERGRGLWKDSLWRTYDLLRRLKYPGYNFETHTPTFYTKRWILDAYRDFRDFVTEDRWQGMLGPTAILNHALAKEAFPLTRLTDEGKHVGFHHQAASYEAIVDGCAGRTFLNFDDAAFDAKMRSFLRERFPTPSKFEKTEVSTRSVVTVSGKRQTILFAWELGSGWGHVGVMQPIAQALCAAGHRVVAVVPQVGRAAQLLAGEPVEIVAAPSTGNTPAARVKSMRTFAHVLGNTCFSDATAIASRAAVWQALYQFYSPDVIVCDHAPTALLAARTSTALRLVLGQGFTVPDAVERFPDWRTPSEAARTALDHDEDRILDLVNGWLASQQAPQLTRLSELYTDTAAQLLATYPELDCYSPRQHTGAHYLGTWQAKVECQPKWPDHPGKRILAYLKPFTALGTLLEQLRRLPAASIVICPGIDPKLPSLCAGSRVRIELDPVDLAQAASECDLAIGHGTHGFTSAVLLAGRPQVMIPLVMEQRLTAQRVAGLGAGVIADHRQGRDVVMKLRKVWEQNEISTAAKHQSGRLSARTWQGLEGIVSACQGY